jgi:hypothetical protein
MENYQQNPITIKYLPIHLLSSIFSLLEPKEIIQCRHVSNSWTNICFFSSTWKFYHQLPIKRIIPQPNKTFEWIFQYSNTDVIPISKQKLENLFLSKCIWTIQSRSLQIVIKKHTIEAFVTTQVIKLKTKK